MLDQLVNWDEELFLFLNNLGTSNFDSFWLILTDKKTWIPFYVLVLAFLWKKEGWKSAILLLALGGISVGITDQITNLLKEQWVLRPRPCYNQEIMHQIRLVKESCGGAYGFTSAHAGNHFALAIILTSYLRKYVGWIHIPLFLWAILIAYSRIYLGVHFPLDVICGALLGAVVAYTTLTLKKRFLPQSI